MKSTLEQLHLAAQYLATAAKSFLEPKSDDSHTSLGFDEQNNQFKTCELNKERVTLGLCLNYFSLKWNGCSEKNIALDGKTHGEVTAILKESSLKLGCTKPYDFDLHYKLPFAYDADYLFSLDNKKELEHSIQLRKLANSSLAQFLKKEGLQSDVRIWPHHFDTGAFVTLEGSKKSVGMGLAIPDTMIAEHYFYMSGYIDHDAMDTGDFDRLNLGEWKNEDFKGAVLSANNLNRHQAVEFLHEAFSNYTKS